MLRPTKSLLLVHAVVVGLLAGGAFSPASAEQNDRSRGVKIIDAPTPAPGAATPASPADPSAAVLTPPPGLTSLPALNAPTKEAAIPTTPAPLGKLPPGIKVANAAELAVEILPGAEIPTGTRVSFRINTKKEGYLLLVDVDATGKVTQIYPNPMSLLAAAGGRQNSNRIKPGKPVVIPNPTDPYAGFEFVASPPEGTAMMIALLSDRPVQMIDLPDVPANLLGQAEAVTYINDRAQELRIPSEEPGQLQEARWSLDVKFYAVR
jgi:Domain of unknown function (DUF4384)